MKRIMLSIVLVACGKVHGADVGPDADPVRDAAVADADPLKPDAAPPPDARPVPDADPLKPDAAPPSDARPVPDADPFAPDADYATCDVLEQDCIVGGCYFKSADREGECLPEGIESEGDSCEVQSDCKAGGYCGSNVCWTLCDFETWPGVVGDPRCGDRICAVISGGTTVGACWPLL